MSTPNLIVFVGFQMHEIIMKFANSLQISNTSFCKQHFEEVLFVSSLRKKDVEGQNRAPIQNLYTKPNGIVAP